MGADTLALLGGRPVRSTPFPPYRSIGKEEKEAVARVMDTGNLSQFLGAWDPDFYGGPKVQEFERRWAEQFGAKHAVSVNSNTSGLYACVGAALVGPGDEVIVSPYTMAAAATAPIIYGGVPVFADIDEDIFCLNPKSIEARITPRTKAIVVVHIFGHPADMDPILEIARKHNLIVIEDCAQAPGAKYKGRDVGTLGHMGVFSLNYHKHIHTGEGGMIVTNDDRLAARLQLIRNHGEAVVEDMKYPELVNMFGFNFRMTELQAAVGIEQLKKLENLIAPRIELAGYLAERIRPLGVFRPAVTRDGCRHVFYVHAIRFDEKKAGISRNLFLEAARAEGIPLAGGYVKPLYLAPMYQKKLAMGAAGFPFTGPHYSGKADYGRGICPVTERMHFEELFYHDLMRPPLTRKDMDDVVCAFEKVLAHAEKLKSCRK
jgi:dTDP-4-amino-4,6-dideoxygalactose transaminase